MSGFAFLFWKKLYKIKNKKSEKLLLIKKISEDIYIYLSVKDDDSSILEKFYKDFMENL